MQPKASDVSTTLLTIRDYIRWASSQFSKADLSFGHGTNTALDEAAALVLFTIHQPYDLPATYFDALLTTAERHDVIEIIEKRIQLRIPAAYLTHEAIFAGLAFYVDERVLVPRSPIAELIEQRFAPWIEEHEVHGILDLCTGSGCIAIACAYAFPEAVIDAVDISDAALAVTDINVKKHLLENEITVYKSDLYEELPETHYDIIISNPPYVGTEEWTKLPAEFHAEPAIGFNGGETGLDVVIRILADADHYLTENGILIIEVGNSAYALQNRFPEVPFVWLEFERGGHGVMLLTAEHVNLYHQLFLAALS